MKPDDHNSDPWDALFTRPAARPSADFAERAWERVCREGRVPTESTIEAELDEWLADQPLAPRAGFAAETEERVLATARQSRKIVAFPAWTTALGGIAAATVIGLFAFATLFNPGVEQRAPRLVEADAPAPEAVAKSLAPASVAVEPAPAAWFAVAEATPAPLPGNTVALADAPAETVEVLEYENVLTMDDTLEDALLFADADTLNALVAFLN